MSIIHEHFEEKLNELDIPFNSMEIEEGHRLYRVTYRLTKERVLVAEIIIQEADMPYVDSQIIFRHVHLLTERSKEATALTTINQLNEMKTGYYALHLAGDGEIFLRTLMRVGEDIEPLYQTLVMGSQIAKGLQKDLIANLGESGSITN
ncbi:hypothetical protein [Falseniella ignava]|uniref:Bacterial sensory transduction regulator n=1 Tax=Falseniella ignava CCUG 37419 TaxID=883112 RepID=K1M635_9LACT|nr:hypothetical protein [Falseniella ignava]EKB57763.1 hypothetical protein HMPREF9707_00501 [Falseniella ignava CCUG 37419]